MDSGILSERWPVVLASENGERGCGCSELLMTFWPPLTSRQWSSGLETRTPYRNAIWPLVFHRARPDGNPIERLQRNEIASPPFARSPKASERKEGRGWCGSDVASQLSLRPGRARRKRSSRQDTSISNKSCGSRQGVKPGGRAGRRSHHSAKASGRKTGPSK